MITLILPYVIALGISFYNVIITIPIPFFGQLTTSPADLIIYFLLLYSLLKIRLIVWSTVAKMALFLSIAILVSGILNLVTDQGFYFGNFLINYIRIIGIIMILFFLPSLLRRIGQERMVFGTLWVVRLHTVLIIADSFFYNPFMWVGSGISLNLSGSEFSRPIGLFGEPSFFSVYMGLVLFYILQSEKNMNIRFFNAFDIILISFSLVAVASVSAIGILTLFLIILIMRGDLINKIKTLLGILFFVIILGFFINNYKNTGPGKTWEYLIRRLGAVQVDNFEDSSGRQRLIGSTLFGIEVLKDAPLFGKGLGGKNTLRAIDNYVQYDSQRSAFLSTTIIPVTVVASSGLLGLLPFVLIYIWIFKNLKTRLMGISMFFVSFMGGGAFEIILWWNICLAISYNDLSHQIEKKIPLNFRKLNPSML